MKNSGAQAEDTVQLFAERSFFADFVFMRPHFLKRGILKEAADVLVWIDDTLVITHSKARSRNAESLVLPFSERERSWATKNIEAALRQCRGARRALLDGRVTYLENPRRGRVPFTPSEIRRIYGVIVVDQIIAPYDPLRSVPGLSDPGFPVHVFALSDWPLLCAELSTTPDFISYLDFRSANLGVQPFLFGRESDLLAAFIINERNPETKLENLPEIDGLGPLFGENLKVELSRRDHDDRPSKLIDDIIDHLHDIDDSFLPDSGPVIETVGKANREDYVFAAIALSKMMRTERRIAGRWLFEKLEAAAKEGRDRYFSMAGQASNGFFFLASHLGRTERAKELMALTALAKHQLHAQTMVGVATEASLGRGRSYDSIFLQYEWRPDAEADRLLSQNFGSPVVLSETEFVVPDASTTRL